MINDNTKNSAFWYTFLVHVCMSPQIWWFNTASKGILKMMTHIYSHFTHRRVAYQHSCIRQGILTVPKRVPFSGMSLWASFWQPMSDDAFLDYRYIFTIIQFDAIYRDSFQALNWSKMFVNFALGARLLRFLQQKCRILWFYDKNSVFFVFLQQRCHILSVIYGVNSLQI